MKKVKAVITAIVIASLLTGCGAESISPQDSSYKIKSNYDRLPTIEEIKREEEDIKRQAYLKGEYIQGSNQDIYEITPDIVLANKYLAQKLYEENSPLKYRPFKRLSSDNVTRILYETLDYKQQFTVILTYTGADHILFAGEPNKDHFRVKYVESFSTSTRLDKASIVSKELISKDDHTPDPDKEGREARVKPELDEIKKNLQKPVKKLSLALEKLESRKSSTKEFKDTISPLQDEFVQQYYKLDSIDKAGRVKPGDKTEELFLDLSHISGEGVSSIVDWKLNQSMEGTNLGKIMDSSTLVRKDITRMENLIAYTIRTI